MAGKIDLRRLKATSSAQVALTIARYDAAKLAKINYYLVRWIAQMSVVELHSAWERYAEARLVAALNHNPSQFIKAEAIRGIKNIPTGLADFAVRGGRSFFDFRSMGELIKRASDLVGAKQNPFVDLETEVKRHLDCLAVIRNRIVHGSDYSKEKYRASLKTIYNIKYAPDPDEFLNANDARVSSPAKWRPRLHGLAVIVQRAIAET